MTEILTCSFDPVSADEVKALRQYRKDHGIDELYVSVTEEGILAKQIRTELLKKALKPYRHLHVISDEGKPFEASDEEAIRNGRYELAAEGIRKDLITEGYYLKETVYAMCNPHRAAHSISVAETCVRLGRAHGMDEKKAWIMGMLHDITKAFSDEDNRKIIEIYKPEWLSLSPKVWHSYTAVIYAKQHMRLSDPDIMNAMEHHTLGDGNTDWDHLLYIADKIEPLRGYDVSVQNAMALKNLKEAAAYIKEESRAYIYKTEGIHV